MNTKTIMQIKFKLNFCCHMPEKYVIKKKVEYFDYSDMFFSTRRNEHITPVLKSLQWLPDRFKIDFKVVVLSSFCKISHGIGAFFSIRFTSS